MYSLESVKNEMVKGKVAYLVLGDLGSCGKYKAIHDL